MVKTLILSSILLLLFKYPRFEGIVSFKVEKIENSMVYASGVASITNPNFFSIKGRDVQMICKYNQNAFAQGSIKQMNLPAGKTTYVDTEFTINTNELSEIWDVIITSDSFPVMVSFEGKFTAFNVPKSTELTVYFQGDDMLDMLVADFVGNKGLGIRNLRLKKIGFKSWVWLFDVEIMNTLPGDFEVSQIFSQIKTKKDATSSIGEFKSTNRVVVPKGTTVMVPGELEIQATGLIGGAIDKIKSPDMDFYMVTEVVVSIHGKPFKIPMTRKVRFDPLGGTIKIVKE